MGSDHRHRHTDLGRLRLVLIITVTFTVVEVAGGLISNSLALLADAGHMITDNLALALAMLAAWSARRPPDASRTYGYRRAEILAALFNGTILLAVAGYIVWEAWERLSSPPEVRFGLMALIAAGGLAVNITGIVILHRGHHHNLNLRAAYLHVLGDMLGSVGALAAAGLIAFFGWRWADPAASLLLALFIVINAIRLIFEAVNVLMEGVPSHLKTEEVLQTLLSIPGVNSVHGLHLWALSPGTPLLTAHLVVDDCGDQQEVLHAAVRLMEEKYSITHSTIQVENPGFLTRKPGPNVSFELD